MKLEEILEDKTQDARALVKLLRRKAKGHNPRVSKYDKYNTRGAEDSFTGYSTDTFAQSIWR